MVDMTDHEQYDKVARIIDLLAKKRYPNVASWCDLANGRPKCHVCEYDLSGVDYKEVRAHGVNHLKERNLLPFV